jgi:hypothetical protein
MAEIDCVSSHDFRTVAVPRKPAFETPEKKTKKEKDKELGDKKPLNSHRQISWKD